MAQNQNIGLLGQYLTVNTTANSIAFSTTISANGYIGSAGQVLSSNSVGGLYWTTGGSSGTGYNGSVGYAGSVGTGYTGSASTTAGYTGSAGGGGGGGSGYTGSSGSSVPRVNSSSTATSVTPDTTSYDMYVYTALASTLTINATATSPSNGTKLIFRFKDNGTSQTLTWTTGGTNSYRIIGATLPTATTVTKVTYVGCVYNSDESYWDVIAVTTQT